MKFRSEDSCISAWRCAWAPCCAAAAAPAGAVSCEEAVVEPRDRFKVLLKPLQRVRAVHGSGHEQWGSSALRETVREAATRFIREARRGRSMVPWVQNNHGTMVPRTTMVPWFPELGTMVPWYHGSSGNALGACLLVQCTNDRHAEGLWRREEATGHVLGLLHALAGARVELSRQELKVHEVLHWKQQHVGSLRVRIEQQNFA